MDTRTGMLTIRGETPEELGIALAHLFRWDCAEILRCCFEAMQDANMHTLAAPLWEQLRRWDEADGEAE